MTQTSFKIGDYVKIVDDDDQLGAQLMLEIVVDKAYRHSVRDSAVRWVKAEEVIPATKGGVQ